MPEDPSLSFDGYRLDPHNACVWRGPQALHLTPKAFTVLRYLVEHAGQLVTRDALFQAAWPDVTVSDAVLTLCIGEIRKALGETAQAPRLLATVHRRGYRFLAPVAGRAPAVASEPSAAVGGLERAPRPWHPATPLVGRAGELARLRGHLAQAQRGMRQVVFVTGEAGIGKTSVVDTFLATLAHEAPLAVAWGQCLDHYGAGEAYLPVLDALGRVCRAPGQERLVALLGQYAPTWLVQLPALLQAGALEALQRQVQGATRERMLRELAEALEALTLEQPLVLVLEDLHWSDHATLDLVSWLARRREPARLLLLGTYRPVEVILHGHPLQAVKQELELHGQCVEVRLEGLSEQAVAAYLAARFPGRALPTALAGVLHQRTEGQPLFLVQVVDAWVQHGWVREVAGQWAVQVGLREMETGVPESVRQLILQQLDGLSAEAQRVLEAASVLGIAFSTAAVAAGVEASVGHAEERCEALVWQGRFLQAGGVEEWPDGTVAGRYQFRHDLYQKVLYDRLPVGRRLELHRRLGVRLEAGYGAQAGEHAAELAVHFEQGRDDARAVRYRQQAAENALRRYAYQEAIDHLRKGLHGLTTLPDTPERAQQELAFQLALGSALIPVQGFAARDVEQAYTRARELCQAVGDTPQLCAVLYGLCRWYGVRGQRQTAAELGRQLLSLAQRGQDAAWLHKAHGVLGGTMYHLGELVAARAHLEQSIGFYHQQERQAVGFDKVQEANAAWVSYAAVTLWALGYPDRALQRSRDALTLAQEAGHPLDRVATLVFATRLHQHRREGPLTQESAEAAMTLAREQGFAQRLAAGTVLRGWALAVQGQGAEGIAEMQQGVAAFRATGAGDDLPYWLALLAEAYGNAGHVEAGLQALAEALAIADAQALHVWGAELHRLRGELLWGAGGGQQAVEAEACFHQALDIARRQQAKSPELRAALSLARLWQRQRKRAAARKLLAEIYGWFTEGFDTADLQEAKALLHDLA